MPLTDGQNYELRQLLDCRRFRWWSIYAGPRDADAVSNIIFLNSYS